MHDFERVEVDPTATVTATLVAVSEDPRAAELVALFNSKDARGKECLIRMARAMPCGKECG